jgi:hypothetical protein
MQIVDVFGLAGDFRDAFFAKNRAADDVVRHFARRQLKPTLRAEARATLGWSLPHITLFFLRPR